MERQFKRLELRFSWALFVRSLFIKMNQIIPLVILSVIICLSQKYPGPSSILGFRGGAILNSQMVLSWQSRFKLASPSVDHFD